MHSLDQQHFFNKKNLLWILAVAVLWFFNLDSWKLLKPDEGRYAEIPREMALTGDWVTPRLNGIKYFEKPPLQYWMTAASFKVFGEKEWTSRLWTALTGFLGLVLTFYAASVLYSPTIGLFSFLILTSSLLYLGLGHINTLDMGMTFFMNLALMSLILCQREQFSEKQRKAWSLCLWAALAFAVLSKGLIGVILPGGVLVAYSLIQRDFTFWKKLNWIQGLVLFLVITVPWFILVSMKNPEFPHFFFIHEHFERFLTKVHRRGKPWWFFYVVLIGGFLPWFVFFASSWKKAWKMKRRERFSPERMMLIWSGFIFFFFSASSSKLPPYILPIFPSMAIFLACHVEDMRPKDFAKFTGVLTVVFLICGVFFIPWLAVHEDTYTPQSFYEIFSLWLYGSAAALFFGSLIATVCAYYKKMVPSLAAFCIGLTLSGQIALCGYDVFTPSFSSYHIAKVIAPLIRPETPLFFVNMYDQTLPFYLKRTFTLVEHLDELEFGIKNDTIDWLKTPEEFIKRWESLPEAMAVMRPDMYQHFTSLKLPMQKVAEDTRRVVVVKPRN